MPTNSDKWRFTLYTVIMVVALFNPYAFMVVNSILGKVVPISDKNGCPTLAGFIVHLIVFTLVLRYSMDVGH
jgi:threonine/homoserine/homoserine lactone efflux protein